MYLNVKTPNLARVLVAHAHKFMWYYIWGTVSNFTPTPPPPPPPPPPQKKKRPPMSLQWNASHQ